ncbi:MAG: peptidoglycan-associated lipoprotein Pal [Thermoanaerobaculia bacterium]
MTTRRTFRSLALLAASLILVAGCKKKPPTTTPEAAPPPPAAPEQPSTSPTPPPPAPMTSDDVTSADLQTLNSRGYLKDAFFDFDKYDLREDARTALAADAQWLKKYSTLQVVVEGHCDSRGTEEYNLSLGQKRAGAVKDYLVSLGLDGARVNTVSYGKTRPFCTDENESCWQQNRRGHFVITAK